jgi:pimeloyl-ACP methyl ester carboxylesterase
VLFIHGIGIGLYPYTNILRDTKQCLGDSEDGEVGIIALEIMPISFRITHEALSSGEMVAEIHKILKHHGWNEVVLVTHSYGSVVPQT